jgi:hypothetical protein
MQKRGLTVSLLTVFANIGLASHAYIGNFTRLMADDLCSIHFASRLGLLRSVWYWYLNWSGRYTSYAADWFVLTFALGPENMHFIVPGMILLWLIFSTLIVYLYLRKPGVGSLVAALALAGIFLFLVLILSPDIRQSLFWWNGMRSYTLPLLVLTAYVLIFQLVVDRFKVNLLTSSVLGFLLFFLSGGLSETFAVAQLAFLLLVIGLYLLKLPDRPGTDLVILVSSLAGGILSLILVIMAPGNAIRLGPSPVTPNLSELTVISLQSYWDFLAGLFAAPEKALGITGAMLAVIWIGSQYRELAPVNASFVPALALGGFAVSLACFPPGVYGYFDAPPPRTMIIPLFFLVTGILGAGFLLGSSLSTRYDAAWNRSGVLMLAMLLMMGFSALKTSWDLYSSRGVLIEFAERWDRVNELILQAKSAGLESVNIPDMTNWAGLEIPTDNPKYWPTVCYSSYYDIQVIGPPAPYP